MAAVTMARALNAALRDAMTDDDRVGRGYDVGVSVDGRMVAFGSNYEPGEGLSSSLDIYTWDRTTDAVRRLTGDGLGYTTSARCVRLKNWDAVFIYERISEGIPVQFTTGAAPTLRRPLPSSAPHLPARKMPPPKRRRNWSKLRRASPKPRAASPRKCISRPARHRWPSRARPARGTGS